MTQEASKLIRKALSEPLAVRLGWRELPVPKGRDLATHYPATVPADVFFRQQPQLSRLRRA